jgi:hypothetical protein
LQQQLALVLGLVGPMGCVLMWREMGAPWLGAERSMALATHAHYGAALRTVVAPPLATALGHGCFSGWLCKIPRQQYGAIKGRIDG